MSAFDRVCCMVPPIPSRVSSDASKKNGVLRYRPSLSRPGDSLSHSSHGVHHLRWSIHFSLSREYGSHTRSSHSDRSVSALHLKLPVDKKETGETGERAEDLKHR